MMHAGCHRDGAKLSPVTCMVTEMVFTTRSSDASLQMEGEETKHDS